MTHGDGNVAARRVPLTQTIVNITGATWPRKAAYVGNNSHHVRVTVPDHRIIIDEQPAQINMGKERNNNKLIEGVTRDLFWSSFGLPVTVNHNETTGLSGFVYLNVNFFNRHCPRLPARKAYNVAY